MSADKKPTRILVMGADHGKDALAEMLMREKYGNDIVLITPEEAKAQGLGIEDFDNVPSMKITAPEIMHLTVPFGAMKCGKAKRRERRAAERRSKRKRGN